jgi:hypothetical protein
VLDAHPAKDTTWAKRRQLIRDRAAKDGKAIPAARCY